MVLHPSELKYVILLGVSGFLIIFASVSGGKWQRRGTTIEHLKSEVWQRARTGYLSTKPRGKSTHMMGSPLSV